MTFGHIAVVIGLLTAVRVLNQLRRIADALVRDVKRRDEYDRKLDAMFSGDAPRAS